MTELPKFHEFMRPLLEVLVENGEMHRHDAVAATIKKVGLTEEQKSTAPSRSYGEDTETESVGWISIGVLGLVVVVLSYLILVRVKDDHETLPMRDLGPTPMILSDGSPDAEGLPTTTDGEGVLWRQHPDGNHDWWDNELRIWVRW